MSSITYDQIGPDKKNTEIFEKIKDTIQELKSSGVSQGSRIENAIDKLSAVNVNSAQNAKYAINSAVVKTSNGAHLFLQIILFLIAIIIGYFYLDNILNLTNKLTLALGSNYYQTSTLGSISIVIAVLILANLLLFLFPFFQTETKNKIIKIEVYTLIFLILSLVSFNALGGQSFTTNYTPEEQKEIITEGIQKETVSVWDKIGCYITFNQECISEKLTTNTAENTIRSTYSLSAEKIPEQSKSLEQWKARPITLNYKIASSGDLKITEIKCYQEKIDESHLLESHEINRVVNTDGQITDLPGITCNLENLKITGSKKTEDIVIIPVLYMTINTTYTLKIPILSEKLYIEATGEKGPINYLDYKTIEYIKKKNVAFEVKQTNNALNFALKGTQNSFPLVYGNSDTLKFDIPIEISENPSNPLGKIENTSLLEKPTISQYFTYDNKESEDIFSKSPDGTKLYYNLYLTENENLAESIDLPIIIANIDIKTESIIKKEDMSTRFKITVRDIQVTNQTTTTNTQNISYNYDTLIQKYINLKQTIQTPYADNIQYKINDIENLISLINTYNNRELTTDETTSRNAYLYGLNVNINELETLIKTNTTTTTQTEKYIAPDP